jgi:DNA polymerase-3 subunit gamma/tau
MRALVRQYVAQLPPPDVVRLLTVLGELETQLRTSGNARLVVEVLLLRWAMMSRTVELEQVLEALGKRETGSGKRDTGNEVPPPVLRDVGTSAPPTFPVPRVPFPDVPEKGPLTVDRLRSLWPRIVEEARTKSPLLGALLAATEVASVDGGSVAIRLLDANAVPAEGIERQRDAVAQLVGRYATEPVRVTLQEAGSGERSAPQPGRGRGRLTEEGARAERLKELRARDPGLSAAVDALDLELLE